MKIYFGGSITAGRGDAGLYGQMINELKKYGVVLTEHLGNMAISSQGEVSKTPEFIYTRDRDWLKEADIVVAEVTTPSLGVGMELGWAQSMGKPIVCFYRPTEGKVLSRMLTGNPDVKIYNYTDLDSFTKIVKDYFGK